MTRTLHGVLSQFNCSLSRLEWVYLVVVGGEHIEWFKITD
jgi:hypothetical protein